MLLFRKDTFLTKLLLCGFAIYKWLLQLMFSKKNAKIELKNDWITNPEFLGEAEILLSDFTKLSSGGKDSRLTAQLKHFEQKKIKMVRVTTSYWNESSSTLSYPSLYYLLAVPPPGDNVQDKDYLQWYGCYQDACRKLKISASGLLSSLRSIVYNAKRMELALKNSKIRAVFLSIWTADANYALMIACKKLGIPVFDVQHGLIDWNFVYFNYFKGTADTYDAFPNKILVWSETTKKRLIGGSIPKFWLPENIFVCGNYNLIEEQKQLHHTNVEGYNQFKQLLHGKKVVLFGFSYFTEEKYKALQNLMQHSDQSTYFLVRFHPLDESIRFYPKRWMHEFPKVSVDYQHACTFSVSEVLSLSDVFVSDSSTMFMEALFWGVPGIMYGVSEILPVFNNPLHANTIIQCKNVDDLPRTLTEAYAIPKEKCKKSSEEFFASGISSALELKRLSEYISF